MNQQDFCPPGEVRRKLEVHKDSSSVIWECHLGDFTEKDPEVSELHHLCSPSLSFLHPLKSHGFNRCPLPTSFNAHSPQMGPWVVSWEERPGLGERDQELFSEGATAASGREGEPGGGVCRLGGALAQRGSERTYRAPGSPD